MAYFTEVSTPLGKFILLSDGKRITGAWFSGQKYAPALSRDGTSQRELPVFEKARRWLTVYFSGRNPGTVPPISFQGSPFRERVWRELANIPYGTLTTYGKIARKLEETTGDRVSAQAVGGAVGHNPIVLFLPCHRVVGADGSLTGFAGGLDRKRALLQLEQAFLQRYRKLKRPC